MKKLIKHSRVTGNALTIFFFFGEKDGGGWWKIRESGPRKKENETIGREF
jgi:hypothetical protein